jgi:serine/threonine protein kinase
MVSNVSGSELFILTKYRFGEELGSGSFGVVRSCVKRGTNNTLAVKIIDKNRLNPKEILSLSIECEIIS